MLIFEQHGNMTRDVKWITQAYVWKADAVGARKKSEQWQYSRW